MRTTESMMLEHIKQYLLHGYNLENAIKQVNALTLHRHGDAIDRAAKQIKEARIKESA